MRQAFELFDARKLPRRGISDANDEAQMSNVETSRMTEPEDVWLFLKTGPRHLTPKAFAS